MILYILGYSLLLASYAAAAVLLLTFIVIAIFEWNYQANVAPFDKDEHFEATMLYVRNRKP